LRVRAEPCGESLVVKGADPLCGKALVSSENLFEKDQAAVTVVVGNCQPMPACSRPSSLNAAPETTATSLNVPS
jgi:hypothetical protein